VRSSSRRQRQSSAIASGGRQGVLFKGGEHVETAANIDAVAFDKTGTLTQGDTQLTDVFVRDGTAEQTLTEDSLLSLAAAVQARSEHHLARATVAAADERSLDTPDAARFQSVAGKGFEPTSTTEPSISGTGATSRQSSEMNQSTGSNPASTGSKP